MPTIIVEDGSIVENANSYTTVSGVDVYATDYGYTDWTAVSNTIKIQSLLRAMRYIESLSWKGVRSTADQPLEFPRSDLYDRDGYLIDETTIPLSVIKALCEVCILCLPNSDVDLQPALNSDNQRKKLVIADVITEEWQIGRIVREKSTVVLDLLKGLINGSNIVAVERG